MTQQINLVPVESSNVAAVGYCAETRELRLQFPPPKGSKKLHGPVYAYRDVAPEVHQGLMAADSKDSYTAKHITKKGAYEFYRVDEDPAAVEGA